MPRPMRRGGSRSSASPRPRRPAHHDAELPERAQPEGEQRRRRARQPHRLQALALEQRRTTLASISDWVRKTTSLRSPIVAAAQDRRRPGPRPSAAEGHVVVLRGAGGEGPHLVGILVRAGPRTRRSRPPGSPRGAPRRSNPRPRSSPR